MAKMQINIHSDITLISESVKQDNNAPIKWFFWGRGNTGGFDPELMAWHGAFETIYVAFGEDIDKKIELSIQMPRGLPAHIPRTD